MWEFEERYLWEVNKDIGEFFCVRGNYCEGLLCKKGGFILVGVLFLDEVMYLMSNGYFLRLYFCRLCVMCFRELCLRVYVYVMFNCWFMWESDMVRFGFNFKVKGRKGEEWERSWVGGSRK